MDLGLRGKVALVAAASKGLGRAVAEEFAREGARVAMCSRDEQRIGAAAGEIAKATGAETLPVAADVGTAAGCERFVHEVAERYGAIDALVVNAGGPPTGRFDELDDAAWLRAVEVTLMSAVRLTRQALPFLRSGTGGSITYMTSLSLRQPTKYQTLILSSSLRAAVHGMLKTLSAELAPAGIRVNAVQPGRIDTERVRQIDLDLAKRSGKTVDEVRGEYERAQIPLGRYGRADEFAAAVVFLASARASYITGLSLQVDGGMLSSIF
ncbi:MAG: SDR family oxidoreductase [Chloroflexota bacterium]|nr:SDR family oxidoreductase [Chloroflexota bacterium]